jgi:hypothetical protein
VYERGVVGGPEPVLIVDGHESRINPSFVDYITNPEHIWHVNLGVPHATSYWQVGDSSEQNGHFKVLLGEAKKELVSYKMQHGMPIGLTCEDVIPLINSAWPQSFGNKTTNSKAIADRGWNPLNRALLLHPEIEKERVENSVENEGTEEQRQHNNSEITAILPSDVNTTLGASGTCFQKLMQHCLRQGGIERNQASLRMGDTIAANLKNAKRLSSAVMFRQGISNVENINVVELIKNNRNKIKEHGERAKRKQRKETMIRIEKVNLLRLTKPDMNSWNMNDCCTYVQYKKHKGDVAMPKSLPELRARCIIVDGRASPDCSQHASDEESIDDEILFEGNDEILFEGNVEI